MVKKKLLTNYFNFQKLALIVLVYHKTSIPLLIINLQIIVHHIALILLKENIKSIHF